LVEAFVELVNDHPRCNVIPTGRPGISKDGTPVFLMTDGWMDGSHFAVGFLWRI
jgi:hypothetical protein